MCYNLSVANRCLFLRCQPRQPSSLTREMKQQTRIPAKKESTEDRSFAHVFRVLRTREKSVQRLATNRSSGRHTASSSTKRATNNCLCHAPIKPRQTSSNRQGLNKLANAHAVSKVSDVVRKRLEVLGGTDLEVSSLVIRRWHCGV